MDSERNKKKSHSAASFPCKMHSIQERRKLQQEQLENVSKWLIKKISPYMQCDSNNSLPPPHSSSGNFGLPEQQNLPNSQTNIPWNPNNNVNYKSVGGGGGSNNNNGGNCINCGNNSVSNSMPFLPPPGSFISTSNCNLCGGGGGIGNNNNLSNNETAES